eukprot:GHVP01012737.1.p1 GENE.GHVP01012737.1~~GHVP01012737.1.p1  ORF type:complete len:132 (-),score=14.15 GHVP01012737.1:454-849(-)
MTTVSEPFDTDSAVAIEELRNPTLPGMAVFKPTVSDAAQAISHCVEWADLKQHLELKANRDILFGVPPPGRATQKVAEALRAHQVTPRATGVAVDFGSYPGTVSNMLSWSYDRVVSVSRGRNFKKLGFCGT